MRVPHARFARTENEPLDTGFLYYSCAVAREALLSAGAHDGAIEGAADLIAKASAADGSVSPLQVERLIEYAPRPLSYSPGSTQLASLLSSRSSPPAGSSREFAAGWSKGQKAVADAIAADDGPPAPGWASALRSTVGRFLSSWP